MNSANISPSPNFEKLKAKLRELFELDKADLDFGIYRVLRQRHTKITEFLDKHLEKTVIGALQSHTSLQRVHVEEELKDAEKAAAAAIEVINRQQLTDFEQQLGRLKTGQALTEKDLETEPRADFWPTKENYSVSAETRLANLKVELCFAPDGNGKKAES